MVYQRCTKGVLFCHLICAILIITKRVWRTNLRALFRLTDVWRDDGMNDRTIKAVQDLRMRGVGYRAIASTVGLSRDAVRNYCKSHGLDSYGAEQIENLREQIDICQRCGKELQQPSRGRTRKFCSEVCRRTWWTEHPEIKAKKETAFYKTDCKYCGKIFTVYGNKNRKYCSHDCYIHDRFWRTEENREPYRE